MAIYGSAVLRLLTKNRLSRWVSDENELCIYRLKPEHFNPWKNDNVFHVNQLSAIEKFEETERWHRRDHFIAEGKRKLEEGEWHYGYVDNDTLLMSAWVTINQKTAFLSDVKQYYEFPEGSFVIYGAFTHPLARGRGLYKSCMSKMCVDMFEQNQAKQVYGSITPDNLAPKKVLTGLGFKNIENLYYRKFLGKEKKWRV